MSLNEKLGYGSDERLLIVNADDFGMCHAANEAIELLLSEGAISSATVMMPCAWAKEAVDWSVQHPAMDVGVHLTFTSEWQRYKWGPVHRQRPVHSLLTTEGYFPADCKTFEEQAIEEQVKDEIISQLELAMKLGLKPTHLDNHMGSLYGLATGKHFLQVVLELCARYQLPFRLPRRIPSGQEVPPEMVAKSEQLSQFADQLGVVIIDDLVGLPFQLKQEETYASFKQEMVALLRGLRPGVSELIIHPALVTEELKAIHPHWEKRGWEYAIFRDADVQAELKAEGIRMINWKQLHVVQQGLKP